MTDGKQTDGRKDGGHFIVPLFFNAGDNYKKGLTLAMKLPDDMFSA